MSFGSRESFYFQVKLYEVTLCKLHAPFYPQYRTNAKRAIWNGPKHYYIAKLWLQKNMNCAIINISIISSFNEYALQNYKNMELSITTQNDFLLRHILQYNNNKLFKFVNSEIEINDSNKYNCVKFSCLCSTYFNQIT